jgi:hypothetical protein
VCVVPDVSKRISSDHRFSILFPEGLLEQAVAQGWAEYSSVANEVIVAFHPSLIGAYIDARGAIARIPVVGLIEAIEDSGFAQENTEQTRKRVATAVNRLVRDRQFRDKVMAAYDGRCAMCGMDWGLIQAAHILPVSAPGSQDEVWNGLGLCGNHHLMFDDHRIFIHPATHAVSLSPSLQAHNEVEAQFVRSTYSVLRLPAARSARPCEDMLTRRYKWFRNAYEWAS